MCIFIAFGVWPAPGRHPENYRFQRGRERFIFLATCSLGLLVATGGVVREPGSDWGLREGHVCSSSQVKAPTASGSDGRGTWVARMRMCRDASNGIREFPDHATFRENGAKLARADKLGVFLSVILCNKAIFDSLQQVRYNGLAKM